jgi:hypothetical protein
VAGGTAAALAAVILLIRLRTRGDRRPNRR